MGHGTPWSERSGKKNRERYRGGGNGASRALPMDPHGEQRAQGLKKKSRPRGRGVGHGTPMDPAKKKIASATAGGGGARP